MRAPALHFLPAIASAVLLTGSAPALAGDTKPTDFHHAVAVRYGTVKLGDVYLQDVFGKQNDVIKVEYSLGMRLFEVNLAAGFGQAMGWLQTADGAPSDEHDMLSLYPLELSGTLRLDFFHEQWVVPTGRIGGNYWIWRENWYVPDGSDAEHARSGGKLGWHWAAGGMLRLDAFDQKAASELQASTGIDDTFIVAEYRRSFMPKGAQELHFSGWEITGGLRFDF